MVLLELTNKSKSVLLDIGTSNKKKIWKRTKIFIAAGQAKVAPPISSVLGQFGINLLDFCDGFNAKTKHLNSELVFSVNVIVFFNKGFNFFIKPVSLNEVVFAFFKADELLAAKSRESICIAIFKLYIVFLHVRGFNLLVARSFSKESFNNLNQIFGYLGTFTQIRQLIFTFSLN